MSSLVAVANVDVCMTDFLDAGYRSGAQNYTADIKRDSQDIRRLEAQRERAPRSELERQQTKCQGRQLVIFHTIILTPRVYTSIASISLSDSKPDGRSERCMK